MAITNKLKTFFPMILIIVFFSVFTFVYLHRGQAPVVSETQNIKYVKIGNKKVRVDLAATPQTREQGLSGRSGLKENEGMLFIFDIPGKYAFWMKDMNFPIDMIWIGEDLRIVYIKKDATPESYPQAFGPDNEAKYVLEVPSGFSDNNHLKEGDSVQFSSK